MRSFWAISRASSSFPRTTREIQVLLGHKELSTTALYTKVDARELGAMLRRCHPREKAARVRVK